ncbi:hypothetical protein V8C86DRAFT_2460946, partial [Haematococcus lacustris]
FYSCLAAPAKLLPLPNSCLLAPHWLLLNAAPLCLASWLLPLAPWLAPGYGRGRQSQVGVSTSLSWEGLPLIAD